MPKGDRFSPGARSSGASIPAILLALLVFVGSCKGCPGSAAREDAGGASTEGLLLVISKTDIVVGDDPYPVVVLPAREELAARGLDTKYKRNGQNDLTSCRSRTR